MGSSSSSIGGITTTGGGRSFGGSNTIGGNNTTGGNVSYVDRAVSRMGASSSSSSITPTGCECSMGGVTTIGGDNTTGVNVTYLDHAVTRMEDGTSSSSITTTGCECSMGGVTTIGGDNTTGGNVTYLDRAVSRMGATSSSSSITPTGCECSMGGVTTISGDNTTGVNVTYLLPRSAVGNQTDDKIWHINVKNDTGNIKLTDPASFMVTGEGMTPLETVEKGEENEISFMESPNEGLSGLISYQCGDKQLVVLFYKPSTHSVSDPPMCALNIQDDKKILDASLYKAMLKVMEISATFTRKAISQSEYMLSLEIHGLKVTVTLEKNASLRLTVSN